MTTFTRPDPPRPSPPDDHPKLGERYSQNRTPRDQQVIIRVDGQGFSRLTGRLNIQKPFDARMHAAMCDVARHLMRALQGRAAYTQSDEVSVLLGVNHDLYRGRTEKLASSAAAHATAALLTSTHWADLGGAPATFDARVWVGRDDQVPRYLNWRLQDARRNALLSAAYFALRQDGLSGAAIQAQLSGLNREDLTALLTARGVTFSSAPPEQRCGSVLTYEPYQTAGLNPQRGPELAERRALRVSSPGEDGTLAPLLQAVTRPGP